MFTQHHHLIGGYEYSIYRSIIPVHSLLARNVPGESPDSLLLQLVHGPEITTLRAPTISDKRKWMREIDSAYTHYQNVLRKQKAQLEGKKVTQILGTLEVTILEAKNLPSIDLHGKSDPFCEVCYYLLFFKAHYINF